MTVKGIEVSGQIYDNEDETARNTANENATSIGNLDDLETTEKTSLVDAINEVVQGGGGASGDFPCGYYQKTISAEGEETISATEISTLIGKQPSELEVGQGILLQGFSRRENTRNYLPFSIFIRKTESAFSFNEAIADELVTISSRPTTGTITIGNDSGIDTITVFLNVVGANTAIIG